MHFGPKCHWPVRSPEELATALAGEIKTVVRSERELPPTFDAVLLSGDFSWGGPIKGQPNALEIGFETSIQFINQLVEQTLVRRHDDVILCPGNHDIKWSEKNNGSYQFQLREDAERPYREFVKQALARAQPQHRNNHLQTHLGHVHLLSPKNDDFDYVLLVLNSTRIEGPEQAGVGYVGYDQIYDLLTQLESKRQLRVMAVLHHHLHPIESVNLKGIAIPPSQRKLSFVTDASEVLETLLEIGTTAIAHGHMHMPFYYYHGRLKTEGVRQMEERVVGISAAGSISLGSASGNITCDHHFQVVQVWDNAVRFYSFRAPLRDADVPHEWQPPQRLMFVPDSFRPKYPNILACLDRKKVGRHLSQQRIFESVLELGAWLRKDARARATLRSRVRLSKLNDQAKNLFDPAFDAAEQILATPSFFERYAALIREDNPKLIERWIEEEMNQWATSRQISQIQ